MTFGELAGLIAAIAFLILVVFLCILINHLSKTMQETNRSISLLTKDMDSLSKEVEEVLGNTNVLLEDISKKSSQLDPAVKAVADVSQSVVDINDQLHEMVEKVATQREKNRLGLGLAKTAGKTVVLSAFNRYRQHRKNKKGAAKDE
ncbi:DUF948 domain-containing protein [uncultured Limosilactobacillus sp.]|uniref:DUF948 domain-containing protein n=1 Tax=uncultured Limosilactobacillus sp. TaxID=2837629 RepID=UPI0025972BEA|nr:DUF948 domain-containing protein [uncultured Limosilactobacillus sp.]